MEFSAKLNYKDKFFLVMAIPIYVPEGIGPVSVDSNNNNVNNIRRRRRNTNNNNQQNLALPNNGSSSSSDQALSLPPTPVTLRSFTHHLITELYSLYTSHMMGNDGNELPLTSAQDNQNGSSVMRRSLNPLPDIIQCHNGISLDMTVDSRTRNPSSNNSIPNSMDSNMGPEESEDWTLELKVQVGSPWRQTGVELRMIADRFQSENARRQSANPRSLKCSLLISFPTAAVACLGIGVATMAWLRKH